MAIIVEQEKKAFPWITVIIWLIVFVFALAGVYYLFFASTPFIEVVKPAPLQEISDLAKINLDPLINNQNIGALKSYVDLPQTPEDLIGKTNPFLP